MKLLHIVNGDSTADVMKAAALKGDVAVWREMLCEGPTLAAVGTPHFWDVRESYFQAIGIDNYRDETQSQFDTIARFAEYDEVILWFEYDLFCQINMVALLHYLHTRNENVKMSLVCTGVVPGYDRLMGLAELPPKEYAGLQFTRQTLEPGHFQQATRVWEAYCSHDLAQLVPCMHEVDKHVFPYLPAAIKTHLQRFPSSVSGLSEIEQKTVELIAAGDKKPGGIIRELLEWQTWHGFGDMQYELVLRQLEPFIENGETLALNTQGQKLLQAGGLETIIAPDTLYGGARKGDYCYDAEYGIVRVE